MLAPANIPVAAGKNIEKTAKKELRSLLPWPLKSGPKLSTKVSPVTMEIKTIKTMWNLITRESSKTSSNATLTVL